MKLAMENTVQCINSNKLDNQSFLTEDKMCWQTENKTWSQLSKSLAFDHHSHFIMFVNIVIFGCSGVNQILLNFRLAKWI
jgi:hypothetical protein